MQNSNLRMRAAVIGGGPAGLMAAEILAQAGARVTVFERMPSVGRKFLLAGRGGLNLTHSEAFEAFMQRYGAAAAHLRPAVEAFSPAMLREWSEALGQETFVGSSGRVFPKAMKASPLLRAWLVRLREAGVEFRLRHRWTGWEDGKLTFETPQGRVQESADATVLALGGASWPNLGSDGSWQDILSAEGVTIAPLMPANSGFVANWTPVFAERFQGAPLKSIELCFGDRRVRGEMIVTRTGLEGGSIYAISGALREAIACDGEAILTIDLRPDVTSENLERQLSAPRGKQSLASFLRKAAKLSPPAIGLMHEATMARAGRLADMTPGDLGRLAKELPVRLTGVAPIDRAISTAGGISFDALDENLMLRAKPGVFAAGEMLDWEGPTGGYLLQATAATGAAAARGALAWFKTR